MPCCSASGGQLFPAEDVTNSPNRGYMKEPVKSIGDELNLNLEALWKKLSLPAWEQ